MRSYNLIETSRTQGAVVLAGVLASQLIGAVHPPVHLQEGPAVLSGIGYQAGTDVSFFGQLNSIRVGGLDAGAAEFESLVSNFYSKLVSIQEPLGAEFERVLNQNLWDLYES